MNGILGKKVGMTQVFSDRGDCIPVTVIQVEKCVPILQKTAEKDGYQSVLVAYGVRKPKHTNKPLQGFYDKHKASPAKVLAEFRDHSIEDAELGKPLNVNMFSEGDLVNVIGVSKGRGFAGVLKRHGFSGGPASHGHAEIHRGGGSIGMHTYPGRVLKGKPMPGRMGGVKVHVKNLKVVRVDKENNVLLVRGAVPGPNGRMVRILKSERV